MWRIDFFESCSFWNIYEHNFLEHNHKILSAHFWSLFYRILKMTVAHTRIWELLKSDDGNNILTDIKSCQHIFLDPTTADWNPMWRIPKIRELLKWLIGLAHFFWTCLQILSAPLSWSFNRIFKVCVAHMAHLGAAQMTNITNIWKLSIDCD